MELKDRVNCSRCEYLKVYDIVHKCHYCDNEERTDDMGELDMNNLLEESPVWCPKMNL